MISNLKVCINAILPLFLYIIAGYITRLCKMLNDEDIAKFNKICFSIFLPLNLFKSIYRSDIQSAIQPRLILYAVCAVFAAIALATVVSLLLIKEKNQQGVIIQSIFRSNFVLIGLAIAGDLIPGGDTAPIAVLSAIIIPIYNIMATIILSVFSGEEVRFKSTVVKLLKNPLIISSAIGIICLLLNVRFVEPVEIAITGLSAVATPLTLFVLGAYFHFVSLQKYKKQIALACVGKLLVIPAIFLALGYKLGFRGMEFVGLVGIFASSTSVSSCTMAQQIGGDAELAGDIIVVTNLFCSFTMFGWCMLFKTIGVF